MNRERLVFSALALGWVLLIFSVTPVATPVTPVAPIQHSGSGTEARSSRARDGRPGDSDRKRDVEAHPPPDVDRCRAQIQRGPVLSVDGDHLLVDGAPGYLIFVSYFDGLHQTPARLDRDLDYLRNTAKMDGLRVMVNWCRRDPCAPDEETLFDPEDGRPLLRPGPLAALVSLLTKTSQRGMLVDVTFFIVKGPTGALMSVDRYRDVIVATAQALCDYRNVLFDLENEFTCQGHDLSADYFRTVRDAVWAVDSRRLVTVSTCGIGAHRTGQFATGQGPFQGHGRYSLAAHHDPRQDGGPDAKTWYRLDTLTAEISGVRAGARPESVPVYLQEPTAWGDSRSDDDTTPGHFTKAVQNAKIAGAAAWTFHQRAGFDLSQKTFIERLTEDTPSGQAALAELNGLRQAAEAVRPKASGGMKADHAGTSASSAVVQSVRSWGPRSACLRE